MVPILEDRSAPGCGAVNADLTMSDRTWTCPACGTFHDRDENAGNLARLPASWAEAQSDGKTAPVRHVVMKRVNHRERWRHDERAY
jgi:transposase